MGNSENYKQRLWDKFLLISSHETTAAGMLICRHADLQASSPQPAPHSPGNVGQQHSVFMILLINMVLIAT